jgi:peptide-methionine (R)-S-oxide reductase
MRTISLCLILGFLPLLTWCQSNNKDQAMNQDFPVKKTEEEWKSILNDDQYRILRLKGTERPHTSSFNMNYKDGVYSCAGCKTPLFSSDHKFDAHCGWPSFDRPIEEGSVVEKPDYSHGMIRTEILCASCGGHLGHVFPDGPRETTGMRYCINGVALDFDEE